MIVKARPLLCELHAHTTWSDGAYELSELVDLYGSQGFDVLVVTDHALCSDDPWLVEHPNGARVDAGNHAAYLEAVEAEAERARALYDLLLLPGLELTYNDPDPDLAAHAVAVGLRTFVSLDRGLSAALKTARSRGAALIAAHPHADEEDAVPGRTTRRFFREREELGELVDRFELFNRREVFRWVANAGLPAVASGDFHRLEHLSTWKTLLPCAKEERAVVDYLRSPRPAYVARLERMIGSRPRVAA